MVCERPHVHRPPGPSTETQLLWNNFVVSWGHSDRDLWPLPTKWIKLAKILPSQEWYCYVPHAVKGNWGGNNTSCHALGNTWQMISNKTQPSRLTVPPPAVTPRLLTGNWAQVCWFTCWRRWESRARHTHIQKKTQDVTNGLTTWKTKLQLQKPLVLPSEHLCLLMVVCDIS